MGYHSNGIATINILRLFVQTSQFSAKCQNLSIIIIIIIIISDQLSFLTQVVRAQTKHRRTGRKRRGQPPCVTACVRLDARREFSTDEKACASRQSATDKGSASAGTDPVRQRGTDNRRE